jgi:hypothetical protein
MILALGALAGMLSNGAAPANENDGRQSTVSRTQRNRPFTGRKNLLR